MSKKKSDLIQKEQHFPFLFLYLDHFRVMKMSKMFLRMWKNDFRYKRNTLVEFCHIRLKERRIYVMNFVVKDRLIVQENIKL